MIWLFGATAMAAASCLAAEQEEREIGFGGQSSERRTAFGGGRPEGVRSAKAQIQLGPRPYFLVNDMEDGELKEELLGCFDSKPRRTLLSIGHRGAPLQFPEHTKESYEAAIGWAPASSSAT